MLFPLATNRESKFVVVKNITECMRGGVEGGGRDRKVIFTFLRTLHRK